MSFLASSRGLVGYVWGALAGAASAFLLIFALSNPGTPFVGLTYVASVPLFLAGLSMGVGAVALGAVVGTGAVAAFMPPAYAAFFALLYALPATFLTAMALRSRVNARGQTEWDQGGNLLTTMSVYPALLFLLLFIAVGDNNGGLLAMTQAAMTGAEDKFLALLVEGREPNDQERAIIKRMIEVAPAFIPGMAMLAWIFTTAVSMGFAYSIAWRQKWVLRPGFSLGNMQLPNWVVYAAAATGLLAAFAPAPFDYLGRNLAIVLAAPFFFVGLAVTHALFNRTRAALLLLVVFYLIMGLVPYVALVVAMVGAVDQWVDFRKRYASGSQNEGENK